MHGKLYDYGALLIILGGLLGIRVMIVHPFAETVQPILANIALH
jgi:hypothetical protein